MSDEAKATEEGPAKAPRGKLVPILLLVNLLAVAGVAVYVLVFQGNTASADTSAAAEEAQEEQGPRFGPLVEMRPVVTNLNDPEQGRYIKVVTHLEAANDDAVSTVQEGLIPIRHRMIIFFSEVRVDETNGEEKKNAIRERLRTAVNETLGDELVRNVYFAEFVIQ